MAFIFYKRIALLILAPLFLNAAAGDLNKIASPQMMMDLIQENRPTSTIRSLNIYTDTSFNGTACSYRYGGNLKGKESAAIMSGSLDDKKAQFNKDVWKISTWVVDQSYPHACNNASSMTQNTTANGLLLSTAMDGVNSNMTFQFFGDRILLSTRSIDFWTDVFKVGMALFRTESDYKNVSWPNNFISKNIYATNPINLSQMNSLIFTFDAALAYANINTTRVNYTGAIPAGAQLTYDPKVHASQFRLATSIQYRLTTDQYNSCKVNGVFNSTIHDYCAYHGSYIPYMMNFFDERFQFFSTWKPYWFNGQTPPKTMVDLGTGTVMYRESIENLMDASQLSTWFNKGQNPYRIVNQRVALVRDVLPLIKSAIQTVQGIQFQDPKTGEMKPGLPPKMKINGVLETDAQYYAHYFLGASNIGYEVSGLSQVIFNIYNLSFKAQ